LTTVLRAKGGEVGERALVVVDGRAVDSACGGAFGKGGGRAWRLGDGVFGQSLGGPIFVIVVEHRGEATDIYEYSVLVTSFEAPMEAFGQLSRDRGDGENIFDEMKNQWGCGGFTTRDPARCRLTARFNALVYDWWNIFVRLADPKLDREAISSRPLFLAAMATRTRISRQTTIRVTISHAKASPSPTPSKPSPRCCLAWPKARSRWRARKNGAPFSLARSRPSSTAD
jgi:hypothetical protein